MNILLLSPYPEKLLPIFDAAGDVVSCTDAPLTQSMNFDFIVSYGYRHILKGDILKQKIINLHTSYLPWNKGADPNFWSFFDATPKGVTIHWLDAGIDTGDIIAQRATPMADNETLASSYAKLQADMVLLFAEAWPSIRDGTAPRTPQMFAGSHHYVMDKAPYFDKLTKGWDTPVTEVQELGKRSWERHWEQEATE